ncbi:MAG: YiiX/YebB-like N1pC/P60 family cysteine hydrolase [Prevotellaceae bacterium]|nr:YiiX/YebB-like N1pC/P60 family cysteine hydrolase [Prevotellaceae bacterium]
MKKTLKLTIIIFVICLCGCTETDRNTIFPSDTELRAGDIVFRRGSGMKSHAVLYVDSNGVYSHVGVVADSAGAMMVIHAVPDEHDNKNDIDRVKMETVEKFFSKTNADIGCVMRCQDSLAAMKASIYATEIYKRGTAFDHDYDDKDTTKMYCCELVEFAYNKAGINITEGIRHKISVPGLSLDSVILPSDILNSPKLKKIREF